MQIVQSNARLTIMENTIPIKKQIKKPFILVSQLNDGHKLSLLVPAICKKSVVNTFLLLIMQTKLVLLLIYLSKYLNQETAK